jgi:ABC-type cobalt transport system substrate-binding protein
MATTGINLAELLSYKEKLEKRLIADGNLKESYEGISPENLAKNYDKQFPFFEKRSGEISSMIITVEEAIKTLEYVRGLLHDSDVVNNDIKRIINSAKLSENLESQIRKTINEDITTDTVATNSVIKRSYGGKTMRKRRNRCTKKTNTYIKRRKSMNNK